MYPPTISFASMNGPSIAPDAVSIFPLGFSLPPMSTTLSLNFSFHAFQTANISCMRAGDGAWPSIGLLWRNMYLWFGIFSPRLAPTGWRHPKTREAWAVGHPGRRFPKPNRRARRTSAAGELRFQLRPARVQAVDLELALVDGGEQGDQLGVVAGVLGVFALGARLP